MAAAAMGDDALGVEVCQGSMMAGLFAALGHQEARVRKATILALVDISQVHSWVVMSDWSCAALDHISQARVCFECGAAHFEVSRLLSTLLSFVWCCRHALRHQR